MASHSSHLKISVWTVAICTVASGIAMAGAPSRLFADDSQTDKTRLRRIDWLMFLDPAFEHPEPVVVISNAPKSLWMQAIARPDAQLQRVAIDTLAIAHARGMKGLDESTTILLELLSDPQLDVEVQRAVVHALIEFDTRDQADLLADFAARHGESIAVLVEPALARWKSPAMVDRWIGRLAAPAASRRSLILAIEGLGALEVAEASVPLADLVSDELVSTRVRMAAARSLGAIHASGLSGIADEVLGSAKSSGAHELLALSLLLRHTDPGAISIVKRLAASHNTAVQSEALGRLFEINPELVDEVADDAMGSRDVNVRRWALRALHWKKSVSRIAPLATLLDDVNPGLRGEAAAALVDLSNDGDLRDEVISQATGVLQEDSWRGCEQAAIMLASLNHQPAGNRLVALLDHPRPEVMVASAWGLGELRAKKHLPAMLDRAKKIYAGDRAPGFDPQIAQLFLAFGRMRYRQAEDLMLHYLPKKFSLGEYSRPAAAWSIGYFHEDEQVDELTKIFSARLNDVGSMDAEEESMRQMCAIGLGRMKSESAMKLLRNFASPGSGDAGQACYWAIERMTGEKPPTIPPGVLTYQDWFLMPLGDEASEQ